jgi:hypothetical protein
MYVTWYSPSVEEKIEYVFSEMPVTVWSMTTAMHRCQFKSLPVGCEQAGPTCVSCALRAPFFPVSVERTYVLPRAESRVSKCRPGRNTLLHTHKVNGGVPAKEKMISTWSPWGEERQSFVSFRRSEPVVLSPPPQGLTLMHVLYQGVALANLGRGYRVDSPLNVGNLGQALEYRVRRTRLTIRCDDHCNPFVSPTWFC